MKHYFTIHTSPMHHALRTPMHHALRTPMLILLAAALLPSCQDRRTDRAEEYRRQIHLNDSTQLAQATADLTHLDSTITYTTLDVEDMKRHFIFEKQPRYQTTGYWVLPTYQGSKEPFTFFPEVEEGGKLLLVSIDKQRRYTFTEINLDTPDYQSQLPAGLTPTQLDHIRQTHTLAKAMHDLDQARRQREKTLLKIRFYEKKLEEE